GAAPRAALRPSLVGGAPALLPPGQVHPALLRRGGAGRAAPAGVLSAPQPDLKRSALGGFAWLSAVNVVRAVLRVAVLAALGRLLLPVDFGLVTAAGVVIWFCNIFASLGVGPALVQRAALETRHVRTGFASSLLLGFVL